jgi:hypothetical protein
MLARGKYHDLLLSISDDPDEVVREILSFNRDNAICTH